MPYLRMTKTVLVRNMPLGMYLHVPYRFQLESYYPTMEIDEFTQGLLGLCDGTQKREEILQQLSQKSGEPVEEFAKDFDEFVKYLVDEGILEWVDEPEYVEPIYKRDRPSAISVDVTSACNLNCSFCQAEAGPPGEDELTLDDLVPLAEQVKEFKPTPFAISGGEPLLRKDMVLYLVEELSPIRETVVTVFTNGTLATKAYAQELYDAGLRIARVSLDGHTAELHNAIRGKGTFEKTLQGIENLKKAGIHVDIVTVISKVNYPYTKEIREFVSHVGDSFGIVNVVPAGRAAGSDLLLSPEEVFNIKMALSDVERIETGVSPRNRCNAGETIYIASNGDIYPCLYLNFPEFKVGNIRENTLWEIYETDLMQQILELTVKDIEGCKECEFRYYCGGGCRGLAYSAGRSLFGIDPVNCEPNLMVARRVLEHGEAQTKQLMQELLKSTKEIEGGSD